MLSGVVFYHRYFACFAFTYIKTSPQARKTETNHNGTCLFSPIPYVFSVSFLSNSNTRREDRREMDGKGQTLTEGDGKRRKDLERGGKGSRVLCLGVKTGNTNWCSGRKFTVKSETVHPAPPFPSLSSLSVPPPISPPFHRFPFLTFPLHPFVSFVSQLFDPSPVPRASASVSHSGILGVMPFLCDYVSWDFV